MFDADVADLVEVYRMGVAAAAAATVAKVRIMLDNCTKVKKLWAPR